MRITVGDGVATTGMPGVTARETAQRQPAALPSAVLTQGSFSIAGATRIETTVMTKKRADAVTIGADENDQDLAHCSTLFQCWSRMARNWALSRGAAPGLPMTTMSKPLKRSRLCLKLSRTSRFRRLRSTAARAQRVEITSPSLGSPPALARTNTVKAFDVLRRGCSNTLW